MAEKGRSTSGGTLIDRFLPRFDVSERHETVVAAPPEVVYQKIRTLDLARSPVVRLLFFVRGIPSLIRPGGRREGGVPFAIPHLGLEDLVRFGFVVLAKRPGEEIVLGAAGRFWKRRGDLVRIRPEEFESFDRAGYAKGIMTIRVESTTNGSSRVVTETRVRCTDGGSRRAFLRYWRVIGPFSGLIRRRMLAMIRRAAAVPAPPPMDR